MRYLIILFVGMTVLGNAQNVIAGGVAYEVKGKAIFKDGVNITETLTKEQKEDILTTFQKKEDILKETEKAEKELRKAEKSQRKAVKEMKKAEKELKTRERAQSKFEDANDDYNDAVKKYEKLKKKGKLSPNDEAKWLKKIEDLKEDIKKAKRKI